MRIRLAFSVLKSDICLLIRKLFGCRINFNALSMINPGAHLRTKGKHGRIIIGNKVGIRKYTEVIANDGLIRFGSRCFVNRDCIINAHERITISDNVTIGPGTYIYDHDHDGDGKYVTAPVTIEKNVWIGANCMILRGVTIGENSIIAAGTLVNKDVPANVTCYDKRERVQKLRPNEETV